MRIKVPYGGSAVECNIPDNNLIGILKPNYPEPLAQASAIVRESLNAPVGASRLCDTVSAAMRVTIVVDDNTRPTPTATMLSIIYERLRESGVLDRNISIVIAYGAHRKHSETETRAIIGEGLFRKINVVHHDATDRKSLVRLGETRRGTPILLNRVVVEADLRILTGSVKPHNQAGYTGGGKAIVPGTAGIETIMANHSPEAVGHERSVLGTVAGNPIREDIEEVVEQFVGPCFLVNVILNPHKKVVASVAGHPIMAHRKAVSLLDLMCRASVSHPADVVIVGCPDPIGQNLYQSMNAVTVPVRIGKPIVKRGGYIIMASRCQYGVGHPYFRQLVTQSRSPQEVLADVLRPKKGLRLDRFAAQIWAETLTYANVIVVTEGVDPQTLRQMHVGYASSIDEGLNVCRETLGPGMSVLVVPDAPYVIPQWGKQP